MLASTILYSLPLRVSPFVEDIVQPQIYPIDYR